MNHEVGLGSRVFIRMPGDHVFSGVLQNYGHRHNSVIQVFNVHTPNGVFTANLQPYPNQRGPYSHLIDDYTCFIPISGNRVLAGLLRRDSEGEVYVPGSVRVAIRNPQENYNFYSGVLDLGEGVAPAWLPRHT